MDPVYKKHMLTSALEARVKEVTEYQVNIDNFKAALDKIGEEPELEEFKEQLQALLASSLLEQRKAQIMLEVIQSQVE